MDKLFTIKLDNDGDENGELPQLPERNPVKVVGNKVYFHLPVTKKI